MTTDISRGSLPATATLTKLGTGGEGIVYDLPVAAVPQEVRTTAGGRPVVYKQFLHQDSPAQTQHHRAVVGFLGKLGSEQREWVLDRAAWPLAVVVDGGAVCGILMPKIPDQFFRDFPVSGGRTRRGEAGFQMLLNDGKFLKTRGIDVDEKRKVNLLVKVVELLRVLQGGGVVVGDLSARNLLFSLGEGASGESAVYLIDCDSVSVPGSTNLSGMETPGWNLPAGERTQTVEGDRYKFALLVLRVLAGDQMSRDAGAVPLLVSGQVGQMVERTLGSVPGARPRFPEWVEVLGAAEHALSTRTVVRTPSTTASAPAGSKGPEEVTAGAGPVGPLDENFRYEDIADITHDIMRRRVAECNRQTVEKEIEKIAESYATGKVEEYRYRLNIDDYRAMTILVAFFFIVSLITIEPLVLIANSNGGDIERYAAIFLGIFIAPIAATALVEKVPPSIVKSVKIFGAESDKAKLYSISKKRAEDRLLGILNSCSKYLM